MRNESFSQIFSYIILDSLHIFLQHFETIPNWTRPQFSIFLIFGLTFVNYCIFLMCPFLEVEVATIFTCWYVYIFWIHALQLFRQDVVASPDESRLFEILPKPYWYIFQMFWFRNNFVTIVVRIIVIVASVHRYVRFGRKTSLSRRPNKPSSCSNDVV